MNECMVHLPGQKKVAVSGGSTVDSTSCVSSDIAADQCIITGVIRI